MHDIEIYGASCVAVEVHRPLKWAHLRGSTAILPPMCHAFLWPEAFAKALNDHVFCQLQHTLGINAALI